MILRLLFFDIFCTSHNLKNILTTHGEQCILLNVVNNVRYSAERR